MVDVLGGTGCGSKAGTTRTWQEHEGSVGSSVCCSLEGQKG